MVKEFQAQNQKKMEPLNLKKFLQVTILLKPPKKTLVLDMIELKFGGATKRSK